MIKNIKYRINCDERGKITTGEKSEKGFPKTLDYFDISDFPELANSYGNKPTKLIIYFPTDNIEDFFDCNYVRYGSNNSKIRQCDGEECIHRIREEFNGKVYNPGDITKCICQEIEEEKRCQYSMYMKAWIVDPLVGKVNNPLCYLFHTGSKNSGDNILSELEKIKILNMGVLRGVPFALTVKMAEKKDNAMKKFPIWNLQAVGMLDRFKLEEAKGLNLLMPASEIQIETEGIEKTLETEIEKQKEFEAKGEKIIGGEFVIDKDLVSKIEQAVSNMELNDLYLTIDDSQKEVYKKYFTERKNQIKKDSRK